MGNEFGQFGSKCKMADVLETEAMWRCRMGRPQRCWAFRDVVEENKHLPAREWATDEAGEEAAPAPELQSSTRWFSPRVSVSSF